MRVLASIEIDLLTQENFVSENCLSARHCISSDVYHPIVFSVLICSTSTLLNTTFISNVFFRFTLVTYVLTDSVIIRLIC
jgi:hypothetical protein